MTLQASKKTHWYTLPNLKRGLNFQPLAKQQPQEEKEALNIVNIVYVLQRATAMNF
jgi:hypothetical protein